MPFIKQERRDAISTNTLTDWQVGDLCYVHYNAMVARWKRNPSWTEAHAIYRDLLLEDCYGEPFKARTVSNSRAAKELAWQVFFQLYVMPYELEKRNLNGDI